MLFKILIQQVCKGGESQVIAFNLCIFAKPYWIILLLEALETNRKKNRVWKHILGYIISVTEYCTALQIQEITYIKLTNMYALFEM